MAGYQDKSYTFILSSVQTCILLLFNESAHDLRFKAKDYPSSESQEDHQFSLTYTQVAHMTHIPGYNLLIALKYLCNPRVRVIQKENLSKPDFAPDEKMKIAATFQSPNMRVVLSPPSGLKIKEPACVPGQPV